MTDILDLISDLEAAYAAELALSKRTYDNRTLLEKAQTLLDRAREIKVPECVVRGTDVAPFLFQPSSERHPLGTWLNGQAIPVLKGLPQDTPCDVYVIVVPREVPTNG